jgi:Ca-activated chloride channel homolog
MRFRAFSLSIGLLCAAPALFGQADQPAGEPTRIQVTVTRVPLMFTVVDKKGRFITNLGKDDFEVFENGKPQSVIDFSAESGLPLRLGILIDTSNSVRDRFRFEQEAASSFLRDVVHEDVDKALLVSFDTNPELISELVSKVKPLEESINRLRPGGGTSLFDALYFACRDKLAQDQPRHKFRRALVLVTDGEDTQSLYTRDQALEMAQNADVVIYSISTNVAQGDTPGDRLLRYYAKETGGLAFFPFKVEDMTQSFENIANELRHQYSISYKPEPLVTDGLFHPITVRVKGRKDLVVRVRSGYFAPKL